MVNKSRPHVFVFPEDDANRQLANGFLLGVGLTRQFWVEPVAGGWHEVLGRFASDHIVGMERNEHRLMVLLIDFDGEQGRLAQAKAVIPDHLMNRVFVLGVFTEPEDLKRDGLGSYETIGKAMAKDCRDNTDVTWKHNLLRHNATELDRLRERIRPILFE